ncbi:FtsQ-type POTRA domain-containing protein [Candidatus Peregrinibacteria bacterium]|nr:FtsQ-type POTRA domain-containing protein [Candidatus Peregrinibacteria bacterium]
MTLQSPQPLPARFRRGTGPLTRRIVEKNHPFSWQYRSERWGRILGRLKAQMRGLKRYFWIVLSGLMLIATIGTGGIIFFSSVFYVSEIRVHRSDLRMDMELIERILQPFFGRHLFFVHSSELETLLKNTVPDIDRATLTKEYPNRLAVNVTVRPLTARLILTTVDNDKHRSTQTGGTLQDFLTEDGRYVQYRDGQVPDISGLPMIHLVDWGIKPKPGRFLLESNFLQQMREAEEILRERFGRNVRTRTVFLRAREFHMTVDKYTLWFDGQSPLADQFGRYTLFLKTVGGETAWQDIDLRLRDRVVYR